MKNQWTLLVICILTAIVSFSLAKRTKNPEHSLLSNLQDSIASNELALYNAVRYEGMVDAKEMIQFKIDSFEIKEMLAEADELWSSIPEGAVIKRGGHAVGKNKEVEKIEDEAKEKEADMFSRQRDIGRNKGSLLHGRTHITLWQEHTRLNEQVKALKDKHAWYYNTGWGKFVKVIHVILLIFGGLSIAGIISAISTLMKT